MKILSSERYKPLDNTCSIEKSHYSNAGMQMDNLVIN